MEKKSPYLQIPLIALFFIIIGSVGSYFIFKKNLPTSTLRIAVIDGQRLQKEPKPFAKVDKILESEIDKIKIEATALSNQLETAMQAIKSEKNATKAKKKKEEFLKKQNEIEQIIVKKQEYLTKLSQHFSALLENTVFEVIKKIAKEKDINIVLNRVIDEKHAILYSEARFDFTDDVIDEINEQLKDVQLPKEILTK
jgi:Skp family chaperone for outer membrane proteins